MYPKCISHYQVDTLFADNVIDPHHIPTQEVVAAAAPHAITPHAILWVPRYNHEIGKNLVQHLGREL